MATSSEIPLKYLYGLVYMAASLVAEREERWDVGSRFFMEGMKRIAAANAVEDRIDNSKRATKAGYYG